MTRTPAFRTRDVTLGSAVLRAAGVLSMSWHDEDTVVATMAAIRADGWSRVQDDPSTYGWIQRRTNISDAVASAVLTNGWIDPTIATVRIGGGWMVVRMVRTEHPPLSRIDIRGELDAAMEDAVSAALGELDAQVRRRWDPTSVRPTSSGRPSVPPEMRPPRRIRGA